MDYKQSGVDIDAGNETVRRIKALARAHLHAGRAVGDRRRSAGCSAWAPATATRCSCRAPTASAPSSRSPSWPGGTTPSGSAWSTTASTTSSCRAPSRSSSSTTSPPASSRPRWPRRSSTASSAACRENGCALLGGETAEMPGFYADGEYDLAGFIVGVVERDRLITGERLRPGDALLGLRSTGLHTNGYSLARRDRLRPARPRGRFAWSTSSAARSARRCCACTGRICRWCGRCSRRGSSRAWRTSPAAASPTTCRASCRPGRPRSSTRPPGRRRRLPLPPARRRRAGGRHVPHLQHGHRPDHRLRGGRADRVTAMLQAAGETRVPIASARSSRASRAWMLQAPLSRRATRDEGRLRAGPQPSAS